MGIFGRIQGEIEAREKQEGITLADLLDLSEPLRRLMGRITRQGEMTVAAAANHLGESPANARKTLDALVEKGYLERKQQQGDWVYRVRFARKRGRNIPVGIWSALEQCAQDEK
jgi:DNA-binding MarR family transcriptional regulator